MGLNHDARNGSQSQPRAQDIRQVQGDETKVKPETQVSNSELGSGPVRITRDGQAGP